MNKRLICAAAFCAAAASAQAAPTLDGGRIIADVKTLSSDAFEGRGPATAGEIKTVEHLVRQIKAAGLRPAGDRQQDGSRAWTQDVPLARFRFSSAPKVSVDLGGRREPWTSGQQISVSPSQTGQARLTVKDAPVVFVGYGVKAPERNWDDFKGVDLRGKVALVLVNDPDFETGSGDFGGKAMTYYGRWTYKFEEAARQGAVGFLVIHETAPASYPWTVINKAAEGEAFDIIRKDPRTAHAPLEGWIHRDAAASLATAGGHDFEALKTAAQSRDFRPVELKGVTFSVEGEVAMTRVVSKNVMGVVRGKSRPDEQVIYTAHWDHLGVGLPDAKGDKIYNGAVDNATGTALLLELGRHFAKAKPERSVVFLAVTAEEQGLLGSTYYAQTPIYPLATTVGVLNMDGLRPAGAARDFTTSGDAPVTLQDELIAVGKTHDRYYVPDPRPEAGTFFRSDHFPFAKAGVPAISYGAGLDLMQGGRDRGRAWGEAYTRDRYHQPSDEFDASWNADGILADGAMLYDLGWKLANARTWPEWKEGAEFKAERDKTKAQRR